MCSKVLPCPLCCQPNFNSIDDLKISLVKVTNRPLVCPICNEILFGLDKLTIHLFSHSMVLDQIKVESERKPPAKINRKPAKVPVNSSVERLQPKCEICGFDFDNPELLGMHMKLVHSGSPGLKAENKSTPESAKFQCHLCNKFFKMKGSLRVHLRVVHMHGFQNICKNINNKSEQKPPIANANGSQSQASLSENKPIVKQMVLTDKGTIVPLSEIQKIESADKRTPEPKTTSATEQSKAWECDICTKSFTTKYFLKKHKRLHTGEMPYSCAICAKTFTFQQSYHKHLLYHSDEKPHVCPTCGRAFKELSTLHNHERIHSGEKPFKCETCGKCFRQRVSYLVHRRIHTGQMPYKCTACAKSFRYKVSQRTHKCPAQPPGTVVRQSGELLQKLLQNSSIINPHPEEEKLNQIESPGKSETEITHQESVIDLIDKSIEAMTKKNDGADIFSSPDVEEILGLGKISYFNDPNQSPSEQLEHLCLYSPNPPLELGPQGTFKEMFFGSDMIN